MMISPMSGKCMSRPPVQTEEGASMPRPKKDAKPLNIKLDATIHEKLEQYCRETGENKTITVEKVLDQYLTGYFKDAQYKNNMTLS